MKNCCELSRLKGKMVEKKETYRSLSKKAGIALNTLNNKLNGHTLFNVKEAITICFILNIDISDLPIYFCDG